jgi:hypothetical protein
VSTHPLKIHEHAPDGDVVETLRELLAEAERGEIIAIAFATENTGRESATGWAGGERMNTFAVIGAIERLKHRLLVGYDS